MKAKVKIFTHYDREKLENAINTFLEQNDFVAYQFSTITKKDPRSGDDIIVYSIVIFYEPEKEKAKK